MTESYWVKQDIVTTLNLPIELLSSKNITVYLDPPEKDRKGAYIVYFPKEKYICGRLSF